MYSRGRWGRHLALSLLGQVMAKHRNGFAAALCEPITPQGSCLGAQS